MEIIELLTVLQPDESVTFTRNGDVVTMRVAKSTEAGEKRASIAMLIRPHDDFAVGLVASELDLMLRKMRE